MRVVLDTDLAMGVEGSDVDDGFALALALAEEDLQLDLVTTVGGNTDVDSAGALTLDLLERLGRADVPVVAGAAAPLVSPGRPRTASAGARARGGGALRPGYAAVEIARRVVESPGEITVLAIGPLTNVALAAALEPRFARLVREVVVMGGVFLGHTHETGMPGEFNFWNDPEAARAVLGSGAPVRLVGLDVTRRVRLRREDAAALRAGGRPFAGFAGRCTEAWIDHVVADKPAEGRDDSCAMHDPLAVMALTRPELFTWRPAEVDVVTGDGPARGVCVTDLLGTTSAPPPNCRIAVDVDAPAATRHFLAAVSRL